MSGLEERLMLALRSRKIKEYGFDDISSFCVLLIVQTYALLGYQNYNKTDVACTKVGNRFVRVVRLFE